MRAPEQQTADFARRFGLSAAIEHAFHPEPRSWWDEFTSARAVSSLKSPQIGGLQF